MTFIGLLASGFTSNISLIIIPVLFISEVYVFLLHRRLFESIKRIFLTSLPVFIGLAFSGIYIILNSALPAGLYSAIYKKSGAYFSIPRALTDWSHEGFGMNLGILTLLFIPIVVFSIVEFLTIRKKKHEALDLFLYLKVVSLCFFIANTIFCLFFQKGNLHQLFKTTLCSPFFYFLLYYGFEKIKNISVLTRTVFMLFITLYSIAFFMFLPYSLGFNFSYLGFALLLLTIVLWIFQDYCSSRIYKSALYITFITNVIWTSYLFNIYLSDGWIFA